MEFTVDIDITNNKALAFINYIRTLDFISIKEKEKLAEYSLTNQQIQILEDRKKKHKNNESKSYSWDEIKEELTKKQLNEGLQFS